METLSHGRDSGESHVPNPDEITPLPYTLRYDEKRKTQVIEFEEIIDSQKTFNRAMMAVAEALDNVDGDVRILL